MAPPPPARPLRIGTRGSLLALTQSGMIRDALMAKNPGLVVELTIIRTSGDRFTDVPLSKVGGKGLFVKEIEDALLSREVDLAVHSMKDVPSALPEGLFIGAVPEREDPRDVLVSPRAKSLDGLPPGARLGTSSLRRAAQVLRARPDLVVESLRGNLDTRLRKVREGVFDAAVLAAAGLHRMGWSEAVACYLDPAGFVPAIGQGALGIEIREDDPEVSRAVGVLHHEETACAVAAERAFLAGLEGGCQVPIGGYAVVEGEDVVLTGLVAALDGREVVRETRRAPRLEAAALGAALARELLSRGARRILDDVYRANK